MRKIFITIPLILIFVLSSCNSQIMKNSNYDGSAPVNNNLEQKEELNSNNASLSETDFEFNIINPILEVNRGDAVVYKAELKNNTGKSYLLSHGMPLITLYVYIPGQKPTDGVYSTLTESELEKNGTICEELLAQFTDAGEYMLRGYCSFSIGDKNFFYEIEDIKIMVSE